MKIGVYTIALNEAKFAKRWAKTTQTADYALVADTGSVDDTMTILEKYDIDVVPIRIKPWRFDDARNAALALMPSDLDVLISLDMDETLADGWRENLEKVWTPNTTRLRYGYVWSWTRDKQPDLVFLSDKIAGRFTHRWKHAVHEVLSPTVPEVLAKTESIIIEHHADPTKSRGQYLSLLELSVREDPHNDRNSHYLGREYFFHGRHEQAIEELKRHLNLPTATWKAERAASMRYIAKCYEAIKDARNAEDWFIRATLEDPQSPEAWIDVARFSLATNAFHATIAYCQRALALPAAVGDYMAERYARAEGAYDLMAVAYHNLGNKSAAIKFAKRAIEINPTDARLVDNLRMIRDSK